MYVKCRSLSMVCKCVCYEICLHLHVYLCVSEPFDASFELRIQVYEKVLQSWLEKVLGKGYEVQATSERDDASLRRSSGPLLKKLHRARRALGDLQHTCRQSSTQEKSLCEFQETWSTLPGNRLLETVAQATSR